MKIVRKVNADDELRRKLLAEQDYELISLNDAMQRDDHAEKERCKKRLEEIHFELAVLS